MEHLIEFATVHYWLATATVLVAALVIVYEMRARSEGLVSISPQEVVLLINRGALLIDLRPQEQYAAGHVNGAGAANFVHDIKQRIESFKIPAAATAAKT